MVNGPHGSARARACGSLWRMLVAAPPHGLPAWPTDRALRLRGRVHAKELELGRSAVSYESCRLWSFTFPLPIEVPRDFRIESESSAAHRSLLVGLDAEGVYVNANPSGDRIPSTGFAYLDASGKVEAFKADPNMLHEFGRGATLVFAGTKNLPRTDLVAESIQSLARPGEFHIPRVIWSQINNDADLDQTLAVDDAARGLAACPDLPEWLFVKLIPCPDPVTRALLVKNPNLPARFLSWAISYPTLLRENPSAGILGAFSGRAYGDPLASAPRDVRAEILFALGG